MSELTVASYNLNHGTNRAKLITNIEYLAGQGVHIFCLQELRVSKKQNFIGDDILASLGESWKGEFLLSYDSKNDYGLGIVWNADMAQLESFQSVDLPSLQGLPRLQSMIEQYILSGEASPVKRAAVVANFIVDGKKLRVSNVHADWHGGPRHRLAQIEHLLNHLNLESCDAEIICGDFNTIGLFNNKKQVENLQKLLGEQYITAFPKFRLTTFHGQHLDHIFAKNCSFKKTQIYKMLGSDHFPIVGQVAL